MHVSGCCVAWCSYTAIRSFFDSFSSLICRCPLLFLFFFGVVFLSKPCKVGFLGWLKNKYRRKIWEKEEEDVRAAGLLLGDGEEGFLVFFWFFFRGLGRGGG